MPRRKTNLRDGVEGVHPASVSEKSDPEQESSLLFPEHELPQLPLHLRHLTGADLEESRRAQNAILPGTPLRPSRQPSLREVLHPWQARAREMILGGLRSRHALGLVSAVREAEFCRRLGESRHVRQMVKWLGWNAHFIIAGLWWLLKETASPEALLAARRERGLSGRQRVQRHRRRQDARSEEVLLPPGTFALVFPAQTEKRNAGRPRVSCDPARWAARVFQGVAADHVGAVTKGQRSREGSFRNWATIGALTAEFSALPIVSAGRETTRTAVRQLRGVLSPDMERIKERARLLLMDALQGCYMYAKPLPDRIPWKRLHRQWNEMVQFQPWERGSKPIIVLFPNAPLEPGQSITEWVEFQRKSGRIRVLNVPPRPHFSK